MIGPAADDIIDALEVIAQNGIPATGRAWITDVRSGPFIDFFETEILNDLIGSGGSTCRIFEAVYGAGKTHLLDLFYSLAENRGMAIVRIDLSQAISLSNWKLITTQALENVTVKIERQSCRSLPNILEALGERGLARVASLHPERLPHPGFANAMLLALTRDYPSPAAREQLHRYLRGDRIGVTKLRNAGIRRVNEPLSQRNSEQVLTTVANALFDVGVPGLIMLFDENEKTLEVRGARPAKKTVIAANLIRRLIDACAMGEMRGTVAIFAVLPGFLQRCAHAYAALGQRIQSTPTSAISAPWRWPTLPVDAIAGVNDHDEFAQSAIDRMIELVGLCDGDITQLKEKMRAQTALVLEQNAGSSFRRPLMKELATLALQEISV
jgi:hypothetical protein